MIVVSRGAPIDNLSVTAQRGAGDDSVAFHGERLSAPNGLGVAPVAAGAALVAWRGRRAAAIH